MRFPDFSIFRMSSAKVPGSLLLLIGLTAGGGNVASAQMDSTVGDRRTCFIQADSLREITGTWTPAGWAVHRGGTLVPMDSVAPTARYANGMRWYREDQPIELRRGRYTRLGRPMVKHKADLAPLEVYGGMPLFRAARDSSEVPDLIFAPTRPGCEFQAYRYEGPRQIRE